jgi:hypothetical protein
MEKWPHTGHPIVKRDVIVLLLPPKGKQKDCMFYETADLVHQRQDIRVSPSEVEGLDTNSMNGNIQFRVEVIEHNPTDSVLLLLYLGNANL